MIRTYDHEIKAITDVIGCVYLPTTQTGNAKASTSAEIAMCTTIYGIYLMDGNGENPFCFYLSLAFRNVKPTGGGIPTPHIQHMPCEKSRTIHLIAPALIVPLPIYTRKEGKMIEFVIDAQESIDDLEIENVILRLRIKHLEEHCV